MSSSAMPPTGPLQVVFSFDTTGSMSGALTEVRGRVSDMLQRLQSDIPGVTTAVVAHGDYCDKGKPYLTKHMDFSSNLPELVAFVQGVQSTHGGDEPEAYEVMLRLVRQTLSWNPCGSQRVLVVIGDAFPHGPDDPQNKDKIDWRQETLWLADMGVRIYAVQVDDSEKSAEFFHTISEATGGQQLKLSEFATLCDVIMAICYREKGAEFLQDYEAEIRAREGRLALHKDLEGVFSALRSESSAPVSISVETVASAVSKLTKAPSLSKLKKAGSFKASGKATVKTTSSKAAGKMVSKIRKSYKTGSKKMTDTNTASVSSAKVKDESRVKAKSRRVILPRRLIREKVPDTNFRFGCLRWSPWKLAAVPADAEATAASQSGSWRRFLKGCARARGGASLVTGSRGHGQKHSQAGVLCELAVQTRPGARRHVVWCRVLTAASASHLSLSRLLSTPRMQAQLERVLRGGCRVWLRWAGLGGRKEEKGKEVRQEVKDVYDYAWCPGTHQACRELWVPAATGAGSTSLGHRMQIAGAVV